MSLPIGIDLGTTFSCVSLYRNGSAEIIQNKNKQRLTPSMVYYHPHSLNVSVGTIADDLAPKCVQNCIYDNKRILGRKFSDVYVQKLVKSPHILFSIVPNDNDDAEVKVLYDDVTVQKTPEQISSEVLKYLKESVEDYLGSPVTDAVITVPAYFNNAQRKATKSAAEFAGLKVLNLITEPVAAAIYYAYDRLETNHTRLLVFDFGGGTLDVSIIEIHDKKFDVKAIGGDTLGGRDFDEILCDHFSKKLHEQFEKNSLPRSAQRRLKEGCIKLKQMLSSETEYEVTIECITGDSDFTLCLSRNEFESFAKDLFERALNIVKLCLSENGLTKSDIEKVILVGGTTKIPKIREMLHTFFGETEIKCDLNPDEAVALGAGIQAALIKDKSTELEKFKITEATPLSLGVRGKGGRMLVFIEKASKLPTTSQVQCSTADNDQESVEFLIIEGERKQCKYNNELGTFSIEGLPPGRAGDVTFDVTFRLDKDGILEVAATEKSTGKNNKLVVTMGEFRLCENFVNRTIEEARKNKKDDYVFEAFTNFRCIMDLHCSHILYELNKINSAEDREIVERECKGFLSLTEVVDYRDITFLKNEFNRLVKIIQPTLKKYSILSYKNNSDYCLSFY